MACNKLGCNLNQDIPLNYDVLYYSTLEEPEPGDEAGRTVGKLIALGTGFIGLYLILKKK